MQRDPWVAVGIADAHPAAPQLDFWPMAKRNYCVFRNAKPLPSDAPQGPLSGALRGRQRAPYSVTELHPRPRLKVHRRRHDPFGPFLQQNADTKASVPPTFRHHPSPAPAVQRLRARKTGTRNRGIKTLQKRTKNIIAKTQRKLEYAASRPKK